MSMLAVLHAFLHAPLQFTVMQRREARRHASFLCMSSLPTPVGPVTSEGVVLATTRAEGAPDAGGGGARRRRVQYKRVVCINTAAQAE